MLSASIDDGVIQRADFERVRKGFRTERMRMFSVNKLSETDPEEAFQDGLVILFCPFCGGTLGDHKHIRKYLAETMPTN